jgi:hypothetical protein
MSNTIRRCRGCGELLHGVDATGEFCGKPRCVEAADEISVAGNRVVFTPITDTDDERRAVLADCIAEEQERARRREDDEFHE